MVYKQNNPTAYCGFTHRSIRHCNGNESTYLAMGSSFVQSHLNHRSTSRLVIHSSHMGYAIGQQGGRRADHGETDQRGQGRVGVVSRRSRRFRIRSTKVLESYSGLASNEVIPHIEGVASTGIRIIATRLGETADGPQSELVPSTNVPYPCIGQLRFLELNLARHPY